MEIKEKILDEKRKENFIRQNCTFKPQISQKSAALAKNKEDNGLDFYKKNKIWALENEHRLEEKRRNTIDKNYDECTFAPHINRELTLPSSYDLEHLNLGSIMKFLNRYSKVRNNKEKNLSVSEKKMSDSEQKSKKNNRITVPKPFHLETDHPDKKHTYYWKNESTIS